MNDEIEFFCDSASARLVMWENTKRATVSEVYSRKKKEGHATGLFLKLCEYADKNGLTLILEAAQFAPGMNNEQLRDFYSRFGFILDHSRQDKYYMERHPRRVDFYL